MRHLTSAVMRDCIHSIVAINQKLWSWGNRTPVHQPLSDRDTTIPAVVLTQHRRRVDYPLRDRGTTFRAVIGLSRRHQSFPMSFPASVAGLR